MKLDGRRIQNPIERERQRLLNAAIDRELTLIERKIVMATEVGQQECTYTLVPTLKHPDPAVLRDLLIEQLKKNKFRVERIRRDVIHISWGPPPGSEEAPGATSSASRR